MAKDRFGKAPVQQVYENAYAFMDEKFIKGIRTMDDFQLEVVADCLSDNVKKAHFALILEQLKKIRDDE